MNTLSDCCMAPTFEGVQREYPLGGATWYQSYEVIVCECCEKECSEIPVSSCCGEVLYECSSYPGTDYELTAWYCTKCHEVEEENK